MTVQHFFDPATSTFSYVVSDSATSRCAIIDPLLDLDYASGTLSTDSADRVIAYVRENGLAVDCILETHIHADHLSSAPFIKAELGGDIAIGAEITTIQNTFGDIFNEDEGFRRDGSQFDRIIDDGDTFMIGGLQAEAYHVPGHTPACMAYRIEDALFVGDTLFMPDAGTARCDFPGGDAKALFASCQRLLSLPADTKIYVCHDYQPGGRDLAFMATVGEHRDGNIHVGQGISEADFVAMRESRDATLAMPTLILPSLQVNMRAGHLPPLDRSGRLFLKVPINAFGGPDVGPLAADS
ncbi:MAG: MBL fold metallo-hydrolase [Halieaceae bacterium]|nr:MBL fold metallo-hydrolase [Halieaceae bacterium]